VSLPAFADPMLNCNANNGYSGFSAMNYEIQGKLIVVSEDRNLYSIPWPYFSLPQIIIKREGRNDIQVTLNHTGYRGKWSAHSSDFEIEVELPEQFRGGDYFSIIHTFDDPNDAGNHRKTLRLNGRCHVRGS
jgi:hypothetical protein